MHTNQNAMKNNHVSSNLNYHSKSQSYLGFLFHHHHSIFMTEFEAMCTYLLLHMIS